MTIIFTVSTTLKQSTSFKASTNWFPLHLVASNPMRKNKLDLFSMNERATTTTATTTTTTTTTTATTTTFLEYSPD